MKPTPDLMLTTEQKLQAIIKAQVEGGYVQWDTESWGEDFEDGAILVYQTMGEHTNIIRVGLLEILLDPKGLRAAYKYNGQCVICTRFKLFPNPSLSLASSMHGCIGITEKDAAGMILDTWLSSDGNPDETIDTAYNLLPK